MTTGVLPLYPSSSASLLAKLNIIIEITIDHPLIGVAFFVARPTAALPAPPRSPIKSGMTGKVGRR